MTKNILRHRAENNFPKTSPSVSTDHDEVGFALACALQDAFGYRTLQQAHVTIGVLAS